MNSFFSWKNFPELAAWLGLILLFPTTVLGYFSEFSKPGDFLYPLKQGIDNVVVDYEGFYNRVQALAHLQSANEKFSQALIAKNKADQLTAFTSELLQAEANIQKVSDPIERQRLASQLVSSIDQYQNQLTQLSNSESTNADTNFTPALSDSQTNQDTQIITNTQNTLEDIKQQAQQETLPTPTPTPTSIPTPTDIPTLAPRITITQISPTTRPTPIKVPPPSPQSQSTPTPTPSNNNGNGGSGGNGHHKDGGGD